MPYVSLFLVPVLVSFLKNEEMERGQVLFRIMFVYVAIALTYFSTVSSVDMWSAREQPCFQIKETMPLDMNWLGSVETWFYPRLSRHNLYNKATDLLGVNPGDVEEGAMYYDSCITSHVFPDGSFLTSGYNDRSRKYNTTAIKPNAQEGNFFPADGGKGYTGTFYTTLTDNKTFRFLAVCSKDGVMDWCVMTPNPVLPEETWQRLRSHALGLGFKKEYFTQLKMTDSCRNSALPPQPGSGGWRAPTPNRRL